MIAMCTDGVCLKRHPGKESRSKLPEKVSFRGEKIPLEVKDFFNFLKGCLHSSALK